MPSPPSDSTPKPEHSGLPDWAIPAPLPARAEGLDGRSLDELARALAWRLADHGLHDVPHTAMQRCAQLRDILEVSLDVHDNRFATRRYRDLFSGLTGSLQRHAVQLRSATVLDLGCGTENPFGFGFLLLMLGAQRCHAVENGALRNPARAVRELAELAGRMLVDPAQLVGAGHAPARDAVLASIESFDLAAMSRGDAAGLDLDRLAYREADATELPVEDSSVDLIFSHAVFEHIEHVDRAISECARVTSANGIGLHVIDTTDHRNYEDATFHPLDLLRPEHDGDYLHLRAGSLHSFQNRLRPCQFAERFEAHGFEVLEVEELRSVPVDESLRATFAEPFRSMELSALGTTVALLTVRRGRT